MLKVIKSHLLWILKRAVKVKTPNDIMAPVLPIKLHGNLIRRLICMIPKVSYKLPRDPKEGR